MNGQDDGVYEFVVGEPGGSYPPPGDYWGEFVGAERMPGNPAEGKPDLLRFKWKVTAGEHQGKAASCLCDTVNADGSPHRPTEGNKLGRLLKGLLGLPKLDPGSNLSLKPAVGKTYGLKVEAGKQGGKPSVTSVMKPPA
ncbi:MAG: hypothetical protein K2X82_09800 [Gemmataceae bacterium]|nr:hypothetical protein [Gemmataceae bacterium]